MKTVSTSTMPQIIIDVENVEVLNKIKNAIKIMQGVGNISVIRASRKNKIDEAMEMCVLGEFLNGKVPMKCVENLGYDL